MTVLVWSTSVIIPEMSWPARVRWKKPRSSVSRWANSRERRSRTSPSWAPHRDLGRGVAQGVLQHEPDDQEHDQPARLPAPASGRPRTARPGDP